MTKRFFVLLLATLAFSGGLYAVRGKKPAKRPAAVITTNIPDLVLDVPTSEPSSPSPLPLPTRNLSSRDLDISFLASRIGVLIAIALVLGAIGYFALGKGSETARAAYAPTDFEQEVALALKASAPELPVMQTLQSGDISSIASRSLIVVIATPVPTATPAPPAPTPAVAAEVAVPAAAPAAITIPADGIESIVCALPWPCQQAINVAACESGRDRNGRLDGNWATNGNNFGLFQINGIHAHRWSDFYDNWMDPAKNAQWAYEIYASSGWGPWDCRWAAYN